MKKKKICILSNGLFRGGTDTFVVNLVEGLDRDKYDITVVVSSSDDSLCIKEKDVIDAGANVIRTCSVGSMKGKISHLRQLYACLKKEKPDVFQTNIDLFNGPNLLVAWIAGVPIRICHSHNTMQERETSRGRNIVLHLYQKIMRWLCWTFSNRHAGCSEAALDFLFQEKWKKDPKAIVVNNGIDISLFRTDVDRNGKMQAFGANAQKHVLVVGRFSSQKNPLMTVDVFSELCKRRSDCDLIWVGVGPRFDEIKSYAENAGIAEKVHFLGSRDDVNELMQCCDAFLFPSVFEGLGIVAIESQAAGLPCLASDTIPKMIDCGGCEFLPITESPAIWATHLSDILNGKTVLKCSEDKLQEYSVGHMVSQMETLFE